MNELDLDKKKNKILDATISKKFKSIGFETLTEIQKEAIPEILEEKNCLIIAPTGSGKTECATIPIFSKLKTRKILNKIKVLYITPLRALNRDIFKRIINYSYLFLKLLIYYKILFSVVIQLLFHNLIKIFIITLFLFHPLFCIHYICVK